VSARILWVGHSTVLVEMDGVRLLTDPMLRSRVVHLRRFGEVDTTRLDDLDAVLISHLHLDHLDIPSLNRLGRNVQLIVPPGARRFLARKGFAAITELEVGGEVSVGAVAVRGAPAVHHSRPLPFRPRVEPMGHVIEGTRSVYFAGDTDVFDGISDLAPVDVALVPIWGWGPSLGPGHMSPREAAHAVLMLRAAVAIPIHWGTYFPLQAARHGTPSFLERPVEEFASWMGEVAPATELRVLRPGQETTV
jgi:L-ascorbate metabolism protein UlaG (beta-lactamase superfamily)